MIKIYGASEMSGRRRMHEQKAQRSNEIKSKFVPWISPILKIAEESFIQIN